MSNLNAELQEFNELCRVCANKTSTLFALHIFEGDGINRSIHQKLCDCLPIKVSAEDKLPKLICEECMYKLDLLNEFRDISSKTEIFLNDLLNRIFTSATTNQSCQPLLPPPLQIIGPITLTSDINIKTSQSVNATNTNDLQVKTTLVQTSQAPMLFQDNQLSNVTTLTLPNAQMAENLTLKSDNVNERIMESLSVNGSTYIIAAESLDNTTVYFCTLCNKAYTSRNSFDEHCADTHWNKCDSCNLLFTSQEAYLLHCAEMHPLDKNLETDYVLSHLESFRSLPQQHIPFITTVIDSPTNRLAMDASVSEVTIRAENDTIESNALKTAAASTDNESSKLSSVQEDVVSQNSDPPPDNDFDETDDSRMFMCLKCNETFKVESKYLAHLKEHKNEKQFQCSQCQKKFRSKIGLDQHEATHTGQFEYECDACGKGFQCKSYLIVHQRVHSKEKPFHCKRCPRSFKTKQSLLDHENRHLGVKPFTCDICGRGFITKGLCKSHQKTHSGNDNRQFPCPVCKKLFVSKSYLNTHVRIHTGEKPFICEYCNKGFLTKVDLKIHNTMHTGEKSFVCETCGKAFARRDALRCHTRSHTGERPYLCNICGQAFTQFSPMAIHKRLHTGERPYPCDVCGKKFVSRSTMMSHHRKHTS